MSQQMQSEQVSQSANTPETKNSNVQAQVTSSKPYRVMNFTFASKKVFTDFLLMSLLIIVVPVCFTAIANQMVKDDPEISELNKVIIAVGPSLVWINILLGIYVYRVMKDPQNYKVDPPAQLKLRRD